MYIPEPWLTVAILVFAFVAIWGMAGWSRAGYWRHYSRHLQNILTADEEEVAGDR